MATHMLTRRAAFTGAVASLAGAGVAAAAVAAPFATVAPTVGISPGLAALLATNAAARKAYMDHGEVCDRLSAAADVEASALPHATITINDRTYTTAATADVRLSRAIVAGCQPGAAEKQRYREHRAFTAAALRRQRNVDRIWVRSGATAANREIDQLSAAWSDAGDAVAAHPVSTAADLHAKLAFMVENQMGDGQDWLPELLADAARLAKLEG